MLKTTNSLWLLQKRQDSNLGQLRVKNNFCKLDMKPVSEIDSSRNKLIAEDPL